MPSHLLSNERTQGELADVLLYIVYEGFRIRRRPEVGTSAA